MLLDTGNNIFPSATSYAKNMTANSYLAGGCAQYRNLRSMCDYSLNILASPFIPKMFPMHSPSAHGLENPCLYVSNESTNTAELRLSSGYTCSGNYITQSFH